MAHEAISDGSSKHSIVKKETNVISGGVNKNNAKFTKVLVSLKDKSNRKCKVSPKVKKGLDYYLRQYKEKNIM